MMFAMLATILVSCGSSKKTTTNVSPNADHYDPMTREIWDGLVVPSGLQQTTQLYVSDSVLIVRDKQSHDWAENDEEGKLLQHLKTQPVVALRQYFPCTFAKEENGIFWVNVKINGVETEVAFEEKKGSFAVKEEYTYEGFGYTLKKGKAELLYMPDPDPTNVVKGTGTYVGGSGGKQQPAVKTQPSSGNPPPANPPVRQAPPGAPLPKG